MATTVYVGDNIEILKTLPSNHFQMVVTSPPYWGLRDYGLPPSVWGGDAGCDHVWGEGLPEHHPGQCSQTNVGNPHAAASGQTAGAGQFCSLCGAWRGCLGLEPTPDLYVEHLVEVFREVRRTLREDGTVWLNLGTSFISKRIESDEMVLRENLTPEERAYVFQALAKHETESKAVS